MPSVGRGKEDLTSTYRTITWPEIPDREALEQPERPDNLGYRYSAVRRSKTAPASYGYILPIVSAGKIAGSPSNEMVDPQGADSQPCVVTIQIYLDRSIPDLTESCRCLLDTGSDFNLISQRTLRTLKLQFTAREGPTLTGLGGVQIFPIGSVLLTWHMSHHKNVIYADTFLVISDDEQPLFDVLLGKDWIEESKALMRKPRILLSRKMSPPVNKNQSAGTVPT